MAKRREIYKCTLCGNIVEVLHGGDGELTCCGKPMQHLVENTVDAAKEKHVPVKEVEDNKLKVKIGSVAHPMLNEHFIEWVEIIDGEKTIRRFLNPGEAPEALFCSTDKDVIAREYCNLHGLWKA